MAFIIASVTLNPFFLVYNDERDSKLLLGFKNTAFLKLELLFVQREKELRERWEKSVLPFLKATYGLLVFAKEKSSLYPLF